MKRNKIKTLKKKCEKAWSNFIWLRDRKRCAWCKKKITKRRDGHAHHIIARSICNAWGRYEPLNGVLLCFRCHFFRLKQEPFEYTKFLEAYLTEKDLTYEELREMYRPIVKLKIDAYEYILTKLNAKNKPLN